jgi:hypothetical protein
MNTKPLDRRRKYYLVLDCETATHPYAVNFNGNDRKKIAITKPLIYDFAWNIVDNKGNIYRRKSFLITEIFSVPSIFNTAYYAIKRPLYIEKLKKGEIKLISWNEAVNELLADLTEVECLGAYNSMFDFKKAIYYTENYISHLYSADFYEWDEKQKKYIDFLVTQKSYKNEKDFDSKNLVLRNQTFPIFDIWGLACNHLLDNDDFRAFCLENKLVTASKKFYSTTAETAYKFLKQNTDFTESHTAIEDSDIEAEILAEIFKKVKPKEMEMGISYFPFRIVGKVPTAYIEENFSENF